MSFANFRSLFTSKVLLLVLGSLVISACGGGGGGGGGDDDEDTTKPEITLSGDNPLQLSVGDTYSDPGATASDNIDGNITANIVVAGDTVNTAIEGTYLVTYNVSDEAGNAATQLTRTVTVDSTPPVITLLGVSPVKLIVGASYIEPDATATDNIDGNITGSIIIAGDTVNTALEGTYVVTYNVSDAAGNPAIEKTRTVIVDGTPPVISLLGANPIHLVVGASYTDPGATASDDFDGDITANIVVAGDTVDTATEGTYVVTYNVSDMAGNEAIQLTRTVIVDGTPPVISLLGPNPLELAVGDTYTDPGATATDDIDGDISGNIVVAGDTVNTAIEGTYLVTYNVSDTAGNAATQLTRTVNVSEDDIEAPTLTLLGDNPLNLMVGDSYTDPGATATDVVDGDVTGSIVVAGDTVNTAIEGTYLVTYNVSDTEGNAATQLTRTVTVDSTPPVITLLGVSPVKLLVGGSYTEPGATATDNLDGDISGNIIVAGDVVNTAIEGTYAVTYDVSDVTGNATQQTRTVYVDGTPPEITLLGANPLELAVSDTYTDPGATAVDGVDGDITGNVIVGGDTVSTAAVATFNVTYNVNDMAGNAAAQLTRVVNVVNTPPIINSFSITPDPVFISADATFDWVIDDANGDTLTCQLDVENDGTDDTTINDCANNTSEVNTYTVAGDYAAKLTVSDGIAAPVVETISFTVIAPLATNVSVDGPVVAGERALYTITVGNTTLIPIDGVGVSFIVPAELSFHGINDAQPNTSSGGCLTGCLPGATALWNLGTLLAGETRTISVNAVVNASTLNNVIITLPVTFSGTAISTTAINKDIEVLNSPSADLALSASTDPVIANETFTYQLDFSNTSTGLLINTNLRAVLPTGVTFSSASNSGTETTVGSGVVVWNEGTVSVGDSLHREITVTAGASLTAGQILKATAELTHDGGLAIDSTAEHAITVVSATLPLTVDISTSAGSVVSPGRVLYTITVGNPSFVPISNVIVQLRVPTELSFHGINDVQPNTSSGGCLTGCLAEYEALWNLGTLAIGETRTIEINATVAASVLNGNLITAPVRVTANGLNDVINLPKTLAVFSSPSADLALSASTDPVIANETFTYQLDFGNTSTGLLSNTTLRAVLPTGVTFSSASNGGSEVSTGVVVWSEGTVSVGDSVRRTISVVTGSSASAGNILTLHAELSHDGNLEVDNHSEFAVTVTNSGSIAALLSATITATPDPVASIGTLAYTITVNNGNAIPLNNVTVQLRVPTEVSFHGINDAQPDTTSGGCLTGCLAEYEALWNLGTMAAGANQVITINSNVAAALADGRIINAPVRVTADGIEDIINLQHTTVIEN